METTVEPTVCMGNLVDRAICLEGKGCRCEKESYERIPTGLDAPYYDLPENIHSAQDLIEYLNLDFANGNILKSMVRQYGAQTKSTEELYEAEKRYFFALRHLSKVQREQEIRRRLPDDAEGD